MSTNVRRGIRDRVVVAAVALASVAGLTLGVAAPASARSVWQHNYYDDYFYSLTSCDNRGYAMKYYEQITGMLNWDCRLDAGDTKWSMDILWET